MLKSITIKDLVLIDESSIEFANNFSVLTGETGAGKSIILNAVGLLIGKKPKKNLVRAGQDKATVIGEFNLDKEAKTFLEQNEIDCQEDQILIKAVIDNNNKYKTYINGEQVSKKTLEQLGGMLAEQQGQKEQFYLADKIYQLSMLDKFAKTESQLEQVIEKYQQYSKTKKALAEAERIFNEAIKEEDYLRHVLGELEAINYQPGEEEELADKRRKMQQYEKLGDSINVAIEKLTTNVDIAQAISSSQRVLQDFINDNEDVDKINEQLENAYASFADSLASLEDLQRRQGFDVNELETIEERLFAIRALARKYGCHADGLADLCKEVQSKIGSLEHGEAEINKLKAELKRDKESYLLAAKELSRIRNLQSKKLVDKVLSELKDLHLNDANFAIDFKELEETSWSSKGIDEIEFKVSTNPGVKLTALSETASGGEVSRIVLALKIALANVSKAKLIIFDEIDTGTGGAVADSIGKKLSLLGQTTQVLAISHSPQVASNADNHFYISKSNTNGQNITQVSEIFDEGRKDELARMLSGEQISKEAKAAAEKLLVS